jgi:hypothetical protein
MAMGDEGNMQNMLFVCFATAFLSLGFGCQRKSKHIGANGEPGEQPADSLAQPERPTQASTDAGNSSNASSASTPSSTTRPRSGNEPPPDLTYVTPETGNPINAGRDAATKSGRPAYKPVPAGYSAAMVQQFVSAHQTRNPGHRYVFLSPQIAADKDKANIIRVAIGKAWNHLSWLAEIDVPQDISDGAGLVFALNAQKIWGTRADQNWGYIANCTPKAGIDISPANTRGCQSFAADQPAEAARFVFNAVNGGPYASIHQTPGSYSSFKRKFRMGPIIATSTHKEAIVCGPRITAYRYVQLNGVQLLYSFSSDEFNGRDNGNINYTNAPTERNERGTGAFTSSPGGNSVAIATEWWMQLPNGFMYWGIHGEGSQERGRAEFPFAIDPANWRQGWELQTGRSCISCHVAGIQSAPSDPEFAGRNGWTPNDQLNQLYAQSREKFQRAMQQLVAGLSDGDDAFNQQLVSGTIEPVARAIREIEGPYPGGRSCEFFCNGKYGRSRQNLCEKLPLR